ncbi:MAG: hypothetical protein HY762_07635, partial [Planctomycetes bacterium]|nr:hypothetical protein [Planctomycetota bacterium]
MTLPQEIILRLQKVKLRIKLIWLLKGICRLVIVAFIIAELAFIIDWTLPDLPRTVRLSFFYFGVLLLAYLSYRHIVRPLSAGINDDDLAVLLEKKYPALQERLISTLQLSREMPTGFNSPELIEYLADETEAISRQVRFTDIVRFNRVIKPGLVAFAVILISASYTAFYQEYTSIWFNRLLGGNARWPKRVMLVVEVKNAHNNIAARGQDVEIIASAKKGSISKAYLHYESPDTNRTELMLPLQKNVFRFDFQNVRDDFKFYVKGGDDQTDWVSIKVLTPPALDTIYLYYEYPLYTKLPPPAQPVGGDPATYGGAEGGNIKAPIGTKVNLVGIANIELKEASIEIAPPVSTPTIGIINDSDGNPTQIRAGLSVLSDGSYRINLTALNTLTNSEPIRYPIKAIPDTGPVIKVIEPASEYKYITPMANIPLKVLTIDDYGLKDVSLVYGLAMQEPPDEHKINLYTDIS